MKERAKTMKSILNTIFAVGFVLCAIGSVGAIDGPTGYEQDNWGLCDDSCKHIEVLNCKLILLVYIT